MPRKPRPKLPPYGKSLLDQRHAGNHPHQLLVIFGKDWGRRPEDRVTLCCPEEGGESMDWSVVAGLWVVVVWRSGEALETVQQICEFADRVEVCWEDVARHRYDAAALIDPPEGYRNRRRDWWRHQFESAGITGLAI